MRVSPQLIPGSKIMLVGEAPGKQEDITGLPFMGASGQELTNMLSDAGINRNECSLTNVFHDRPPNNDLSAWYVSKKEGGVGPAIAKGKFFTLEHYNERKRLFAEIAQVKPNIIIALGNTACWALLDKTGIMGLRGAVAWSMATGYKVLPAYHPAAILREWGNRPATIMDFMKARRECESPELKIPHWRILIEPTLENIYNAMQFLTSSGKLISYDIETSCGQITCIGFAESRFSIVIPFVDFSKPGNSYWPTMEHEREAWKMVKMILESESEKITQNGLYDIQYLLKYKIRPRFSYHDTMLLHHSIQPEMPKSLGFLGSVYTDFPSWKDMRPKGNETVKKDE